MRNPALTVRFHPDDYDELHRVAEDTGVTVSEVIREAVGLHLGSRHWIDFGHGNRVQRFMPLRPDEVEEREQIARARVKQLKRGRPKKAHGRRAR